MSVDPDQVESQAIENSEEAWRMVAELRRGDTEDLPHQIHQDLLACRAALDRIGYLAGRTALLAAWARTQHMAAKDELDDAWNEQATRSNISFSHSEPAPRERYAKYSQQTVAQAMRARQAERRLTVAEAALESVRLAHRTAQDARWTLDARIKLTIMDTRLER